MLTQEVLAKVLDDSKNQTKQTPRLRASDNNAGRGIGSTPERLTEYLKARSCTVARTKKGADDSVVLILDRCPMNPEHGQRGETAVVWRPDRIGFSCKHSTCSEIKWTEVRGKIDPEYDPDNPEKSASFSQATRLVEIALAEAELFHDADSEAYATIRVADHRETWPVRSKSFRRWLSRRFHEAKKRVPNSQALQDALTTIAGRAEFEGVMRSTHVRLAEHEGAIYLDLADDTWRVVEINAKGWRILADSPVRFLRSKGTLALPEPQRGGKIQALRHFINVPDGNTWILFVSFVIGAFNPKGPYPMLVLNGEQGSAKSTAARIVRELVDPNRSPLRSPPREERDLMISAMKSHVLAFDNVGHIPDWLSNAFCRLATGGGFGTRGMYTDDEEIIFDACRPLVLTGIGDLTTQSDALDRTVRVTLLQIEPHQRRREKEFWEAFVKAKPRILGAFLDAVSVALRNKGRKGAPNNPRMADFADWVNAAEPALPWKRGDFEKAYKENRRTSHELALEASPIAAVVRRWFTTMGRIWTGTATALLAELRKKASEHETKQPGWPKSPNRLSNELKKLAPDLRDVGIDIAFGRDGHDRSRTITFRKVAQRVVRIDRRQCRSLSRRAKKSEMRARKTGAK